MFKRGLSFFVAGCFFLSILVIGVGPSHASDLTYSIFFPATHTHTVLATEWAKEIEKRTKGALKVTMFPGATLTPPAQSYDGVVKGISDIAMGVLSYTAGRFPLMEVVDMPLGYKGGIYATRMANALYKKFQPKELDDVKVLYLHAHGSGILHSKKPVTKLEDLKGMKIRSTGTTAKLVTHLGGSPVAMPQTETYDALQKGVVDGVMNPFEALKGWKIAEVIKSSTMNYGSAYSIAFFVVMNKKKWDALPKDTQAIIEKVNEEWIEKTGKTWDEIDKAGIEFTKSKGNQVIALSKQEDERWAQLAQPILKEYVQAMKAKGLPGDEALKFCQDWLKKNQ
ncbi:MAG: C4-dicarboxylate ABC transporter substrate-binding protein [Desulfobacca sp.]|nr:C4-dicarboxylate ABC transporter substrate-binding protein [Desulfobacca sp.]